MSHPLPLPPHWSDGGREMSPGGPTGSASSASSARPIICAVMVATPAYLREQLARFEQQYGITSHEFLRRDARAELGELEDSEDAFEWYSLCYLAIADGVLEPPSGWPEWPEATDPAGGVGAGGGDDQADAAGGRHMSQARRSW